MSWDEKLFGWLYEKTIGRKSTNFEDNPAAVALEDHLGALEIFASAAAMETIVIRPTCDLEAPGCNFVPLPPLLAVLPTAEQNLWLYRFRILQHCVQRTQPIDARNLSLIGRWQQSVAAFSGTVDAIRAEFGGFYDDNGTRDLVLMLQDLPERWWLDPESPGHVVGLIPTPMYVQRGIGGAAVDPGHEREQTSKVEIQVATAAKAKRITLEEEDHNPLMHSFEKTYTADEYHHGNRQQEGVGEEDLAGDAIQELVFRHVVRSDQESDVMFRSQAIVDAPVEDDGMAIPETKHAYRYPEWFGREHCYRQNWCAVFEQSYKLQTRGIGLPLLPQEQRLREVFANFLNCDRPIRRQLQGDEIDIDAATNSVIQRRAAGIVEERVYQHRRKLEQDVAVLVLVDTSLSTDSWVLNQRVMDLIQQGVAVLGNTFMDVQDRLAIAGFHSYSRSRCHFDWIKAFDDSWYPGLALHPRLKPSGHTRIGPIMRHAAEVLRKKQARRRSVFLLSDARPSDLDHYEGRHGNEDTRKAIQELQASQIDVQVFAIEKQQHPRLQAMFGTANCHLYRNRNDLSLLMFETFLQLMY